MKKLFAGILALSLIMCIGFASASAGSSSDPLVSKDYIENTYKNSVITKGDSMIDSSLNGVYNSAVQNLNDKITQAAGVSYAANYDSVNVEVGKYLFVYTGGSVTMVSGGLKLNAGGGTVLNLTDGVEFSGSSISANKRYFSAENTIAVYEASSATKCFVNGYYKISDSSEIDSPPIADPDPNVREFGPNIFKDVSKDDWYYNAVAFVYSNYIFNGIEDDEFGVDIDISRADFVTVLYRLAGEPTVTGNSKFDDVQDSAAYYYKAILWGSQNGIVYGSTDTEFDPFSPVTREQMAAYMYRYAKYQDEDMTIVNPDRYSTFPDRGSVSDYAVEPLKWAVGNGIINGTDGKIDPQGNAVRSHVAQIIYNFCSYGL